MNKTSFIKHFISSESLCDKQILRQIINSLDHSLTYKLISYEDTLSEETTNDLLWSCRSAGNSPKPSPSFHRNEPVSELLHLFTTNSSGKVSYARKHLCLRFPNLSFDEQSDIIAAFMQRATMTDMIFCCKVFVEDAFWNDDFLPQLESLFIVCIERRNTRIIDVAKVIARHSSPQFIAECIGIIDHQHMASELSNTLSVLLIAHPSLPSDLLTCTHLRPAEYAYIMAKKNQPISEDEALQALYSALLQETNNPFNSPLKALSPDRPSYKTPLSITTWAISRLGFFDLLLDFGVTLQTIQHQLQENPDLNILDLIPQQYRHVAELHKDSFL